MRKMNLPIEKRLLSKRVIDKDDHWLWQGARYKDKYGNLTHGRISIAEKTCYVHILAYEIWCGPIHFGLQVNHLCGISHCFNPEHLYTGTQKENMRDRKNHGNQIEGSNSVHAKLSNADVLEIKQLLKEGVRPNKIASRFGVSQSTISNIKAKRNWKHL